MASDKAAKLESVTFYKGIAIIMVVLVHSSQVYELPDIITQFTKLGQMGCQILFVLSAFTLCISYSKKSQGYPTFVWHRFLKLGIGYWWAIILNLLIANASICIVNKNILNTSTNALDIVINILLLNGFTPTLANNYVVRGGWFVGTIMIFYLLFPFLYRIFSSNNKWWIRWRIFLFPMLLQVLLISLFAIIKIIDPSYNIGNNSFSYFSLINQLPCISLGFSLFTLYQNGSTMKIRNALIKSIASMVLLMLLFNSDIEEAFTIIPIIFGISFLYLYIFTIQKSRDYQIFRGIILKFGEYSYQIFLVHSFVVYEFQKAIIMILDRESIKSNQ